MHCKFDFDQSFKKLDENFVKKAKHKENNDDLVSKAKEMIPRALELRTEVAKDLEQLPSEVPSNFDLLEWQDNYNEYNVAGIEYSYTLYPETSTEYTLDPNTYLKHILIINFLSKDDYDKATLLYVSYKCESTCDRLWDEHPEIFEESIYSNTREYVKDLDKPLEYFFGEEGNAPYSTNWTFIEPRGLSWPEWKKAILDIAKDFKKGIRSPE